MFLDKITNRAVEINLGSIYDYRFHIQYLDLRDRRSLCKKTATSPKESEQIEKFIPRFRYKNQSKASANQELICINGINRS